MTNFKMTVRAACVVSTCSPLPPPIKGLTHWLSGKGGWESAFGHEAALPPPTISGQSAFKGAFQGCIGRGRGLRLETAQSALAVILKLVTWWSDQRHLDCFGVLLIFSSRVGLLPFLWGQFSELWRLMSRLQSGHHVVKSFHLMGVSVSTGQLTGYGSEYYLQPLAKN